MWGKVTFTGDGTPLRLATARFLYEGDGPSSVLIFDLGVEPAVNKTSQAMAMTASEPEIYILRSRGYG
jgi:hypothetical protein